MARYCVRKKVEGQDVAEVECNTSRETSATWDVVPLAELRRSQKKVAEEVEGTHTVSCTTWPKGQPDVHEVSGSSPPCPRTVPVPESPPLSAQTPSPPSLPIQLPHQVSSFDANCTPSRAPIGGRGPTSRTLQVTGIRPEGLKGGVEDAVRLHGCGGLEAHCGRR